MLKKELPLKVYLLSVFFILSVMLSTVAVINYIVDPYGVYDAFSFSFNRKKPQINNFTRFHKTQKLISNTYDCVFVGSSRVEGIFDEVKNRTFRELCPVYYNAGLNGVNILEVYYAIRIAVEHAGAKVIFWGIDFLQFHAGKIQPRSRELNLFKYPLLHRYLILLSRTTLHDSIKTINAREDSFYKENGAWLILENYSNMLGPHTRILDLFLLNERAFYHNFCSDYSWEKKDVSSFAIYENILDFLYENDIRAYFFINPFHVRLLEVLDKRTGYEKFEEWKILLLKSNLHKAKYHKKKEIPLWDFSGYNEITAEEINSGTESMKYYFLEGSHCNHTVGEIMLDTMLEKKQTVPGFGVLLTEETIRGYLEEQRKKREIWRSENRKQIEEMERYIY